LNEQLHYDPLTEEGGLLLGDSLLVAVQNDIRRIATNVIPGLPVDMNRLSALGITSVPETGKLVIDEAMLQDALLADPSAVADLFSTSATTTNPDITYLSSTQKTVPSRSGFTVDITQAATRGQLEGALLGGFSVTLTTGNNRIQLVVDGVQSSVLLLPAKTYATGDELAAELQAQLNADTALAGKHVSVEYTGGRLVFISSSYGSSSSVQLGPEPENSAFDALGLTGAVATAGQNVAGTINGEAATGSGQILTGAKGNPTTSGLALLVTLTPSEVNLLEPEGVVTVVEGVAARLKDRLQFLTDPIDGRFATRTDTMNRQIEELDADIERMEKLLEQKRISLLEDFARLEASLSLLNSQGEYLIEQLANLPRIDTIIRGSDD
jgi:flagellar hook-associated protein 2